MPRRKHYIGAFAFAVVGVCLLGEMKCAVHDNQFWYDPNAWRIFYFGSFLVVPVAAAFASRIFTSLGVLQMSWFLFCLTAGEVCYLQVESDPSYVIYATLVGGFVGSTIAFLLASFVG